MRLLLPLFLVLFLSYEKAHACYVPFFYADSALVVVESRPPIPIGKFIRISPEAFSRFKEKTNRHKRLTAFSLAILLGPFGVHRLYLGTEPVVPVAYVLTLGGGMGIIPAIDAVLVLVTKDLRKFENNPKYFMWVE